jgi:hypothetical protein
MFCDGLENTAFHIRNQQYTKEEYAIKKKELLQEKNKFMTYYHTLQNKGKNF